ncbi:MBL fold metallo-hydrolase, partial [Actinomadura darangshiensis]|uniref:MBL fold metallo-hydrolase n=1 Tax=Actinomadura darangshiensis TaxID=705336 RepID=UPI001408DD43
MILTVVGCAGTVPGPDAACSCYLLEHDGFRLLLDAGTGALGPLQRFIDPCELDAVVISHPHRDHCSDLMPLAYLRDRRGAPKRLPVIAPAGTSERVLGPTDPPAYATALDWHDPSPAIRMLGPFTIETAPVRHSVPALAVRVTLDSTSLTYSGDSGECPELLELARGTDLLLCEAAAAVETPGSADVHLTPAQAARLAKGANAAHLILTHLRPWADPIAALEEARQFYDAPIT